MPLRYFINEAPSTGTGRRRSIDMSLNAEYARRIGNSGDFQRLNFVRSSKTNPAVCELVSGCAYNPRITQPD